MRFTPPYIYQGLYAYEDEAREINEAKCRESYERFLRGEEDRYFLKLPVLVWTTEGLPSEWDGIIKPEHSYFFSSHRARDDKSNAL